jgi:hypothetical protein
LNLPSATRARTLIFALLAGIAPAALAQGEAGAGVLPSLAALEAAGAIIGEIHVKPLDIFDLDDPEENNWLFRAANRLHIQTQPGTIRRQLLFSTGERLSVRLIEETERLLRATAYLYDVDIRPVAWRDGVVDLEVRTRDTWTLQPGAKVAYTGGTTRGGVSLQEQNLLGTGTSLGIAWHSSSAVSTAGGSRRSVDLDIHYPFAFDDRTSVSYGHSSFDEGSTRFLSLDRPFYALDARWAAGAAVSRDDRVVSSYADGVVAAHFRQRRDSAHALLGGSQGLVRGWAHRLSGGLRYQDEAYQVEPGLAGPVQLPADRTLVVPFLRYEALQEEFRKVTNFDQIGRPEYLLLGWHAWLEFGRAASAFGSTQEVSQYAFSLSKGVRFAGDGALLASASFSGEYAGGRTDRESLSAAARFYQRLDSSTVYYLSLAAGATNYSDATQFLSLGGENGLRGYPTNYQLGARRVLLTAERRFYSDWYPFRLVRVGGAVFFDLGRAWGGPYQNSPNAPWLADLGFGLRLLSARSSSGTTVHVDLAFPIAREAGVKSVQFSLQSKTGF